MLQDSISRFRKTEKRPGMIGTLRVKKLRKETLFFFMTVSFAVPWLVLYALARALSS